MSSNGSYSTPARWKIDPFSDQAGKTKIADWANLFTLCLAPLIAHVFGGCPTSVYLSNKSPRWHDRICQYNPTTILWRYFVIADRRLRAKTWTAADMAASNAFFWTGRGWDGSIEMIEKSRSYCLRLPSHHRVRILSGSMLTTIIVTLQGVMAIKTLVDGTGGAFAATVNISSIFYPLAVFGLLRLYAAMWLTDDYLYYADTGSPTTTLSSTSDVSASKEAAQVVELRTLSTMSLLDSSNDDHPLERFHPTGNWRSILFRIFYLVPVCCLLAVCIVYLVPRKNESGYTVTTFLLVLFYTFFLTASVFVFGFYFLRGNTTNTIIPCFSTIWYKIYTCMVMALMIVLIIIACLETRKSVCGTYTTLTSYFDADVCPGAITLKSNSIKGYFGVVADEVIGPNGTLNNAPTKDASETSMVLQRFDGVCLGTPDLNLENLMVVVRSNVTITG